MFIMCHCYSAFTFLLFLVVACANAPFAEAYHHHRDLVSLKRVVKNRSPQIIPFPVGGSPSTPTPTSILSSAKTSTTSSTPASTSSLNNAVISQTPNAPPTASGNSSTDTSANPTSDDLIAHETVSLSTGSQDTDDTGSAQTSVKASAVTSWAGFDSSTTSTSEPSTQSSTTTKGLYLVFIIVASSVAAVAVIWTVFRKWKLGRSSRFDERLNPIDWQPTNADDGPIPGAHRRLSRPSFTSQATFSSVYGPDSISPLPEHDFTAGPAIFSSNGGYANLSRGAGPLPLMHQASYRSVTAPSNYDAGVPLHHQPVYITQEPFGHSGEYE